MSSALRLLLIAVTLVMSGSARKVLGEEFHPKLDPAVRAALGQSLATTTLRVIVTARPGRFTNLRARVLKTGRAITSEHRFIDALTAGLSASDIASLESDPSVTHISLDHLVRSTTDPDRPGPAAPDAPVAPAVPQGSPVDDVLLATLGVMDCSLTGKGVGVAVLDSGHQSSPQLPAYVFRDFVSNISGAPYDDYGHGTHISGLIRASAAGANPRAGNGMVGVAPGVRLTSMKVLDGNGQGYTSTVLTALESVLNNRGSFGINVVNLSLGHPITEPAAVDPLVLAVEALTRQGLIVVVAAGNWGRHPSTGLAAYAGITSPGNAPSALTVGAFDTNQTTIRSDDSVPYYSSRGPTWYDGLVKPDVVAPGHDLPSLAAIGSSLYDRFPEQRVLDANGDPRFLRLSGTSMATAVTTGVVALMIERNRLLLRAPLTPNDVKALLQFTAIPIADCDVLTQGTGALNAAGALSVVGVLNDSQLTEWRAASVIDPVTVIGSEPNVWSQAIVWGHTMISGDTVYANEPAWGAAITWGSAVVWGHGTASVGDLVWDQAPVWSINTIWDPLIAPAAAEQPWPELDGQAVVWGHGGPH